jgi:arginase
MRKSIKLITVPFDSAHFNKRMGEGPLYIIDSGLVEKIKSEGNEVFYEEILHQEAFPTEIASSFVLLSLLKEEISKVTQIQSLPIVLSGNCWSTVGVLAGQDNSNIGVIWFDAHGDCETPETSTSGFLDGIAISMLLNNCWRNLLSSHKLSSKLTGKNIALIGARNLSKYEEQFIETNRINHVTVDEIKHSNADRIKSICTQFIGSGIQKLHLHADMDVIDPSVAPSNSYAVKNGLSKNEVLSIINSFISEIPLCSATIASYDPTFDKEGHLLNIIDELIELIIK